MIGLVAVGALVPLTVGLAAYLLSFGLPLTGADLVLAKVRLFRPHLLQDVTFGNVGHLADFALLVLPLGLIGAGRASFSRSLRAAMIVCGIGAALILIATLSRSALLVGVLTALTVGLVLVRSGDLRIAAFPLAATALLGGVLINPSVRAHYAGLMPEVAVLLPIASSPPGGSQPADGEPKAELPPIWLRIEPKTADQSELARIDAVRTGLDTFARRPLGVGPGQYELLDTAHTASHSLVIELLVEDGILGGAAFLGVLGYVVAAALRLSVGARKTDLDRLAIASVAGAGAFLIQGTIAGAPLSIGSVNVWALLFWLEIAALAKTSLGTGK
jgi:hypothetical protein